MDKLKSIILLIAKSMSSLKKKLFFNGEEYFVFLTLFICWFFPFNLTYQNVKSIEDSLKVNVRRNTPPLIALMDESISPSFRKIQLPLSEPLLQENKPLVIAKSSLNIPSKRILRIKKPLLISSEFMETESIKTKPFKAKSLTPFKTLRLKGMTLSNVKPFRLYKGSEDHIINTQAQTSEHIVGDTTNPTISDSTDKFSDFETRWFAYMQEIEEKRNKMSFEKLSLNEDASVADLGNSISQQKWVGDVWVGLPGQKPSPKPKPLIISYNANTNNVNTNNVVKNVISNSNIDREISSRQALISYTDMISASGMSSASSLDKSLQEKLMDISPVKILGDVTLLSGLGFLDGDALSVEYVDSCSFVSEADIDLTNGRFSIDIEDPSSGVLRAQLRSRDGLLRGSGQISLKRFLRDKFLEDFSFVLRDTLEINLPVTPLDHSSAMKIFNVGDNREPLREASVEIEDIGKRVMSDHHGLFSIPEMLIGSSFIARIHTGELFKTLFLSTNDMAYNWDVPDNTLLTSLQRQVPNLNLDLGMIWGRVLKDGKPLEGVSLELAENQNRPYYLTEDNQFIEGGTTTSTGYFAYVNIPPGIQLLRGYSEEFAVPARVLWTDRGYISSLTLEETLRKEAEACVFDSQTGDLLSAQVNYLGSDVGEVDIPSGRLNLSFLEGVDPLYFELRPSERGYYPVILTSHRNKETISFPVPSRAWINDLAGRHKITQHPGLSMIIGHVSNSSFKVYKEDINEHTEIVYFDSENSSQKPLSDLERGGFVLFNVEPGLHSMILEPSYSEQSVAVKTVIVTDDSFVSVFSHDF